MSSLLSSDSTPSLTAASKGSPLHNYNNADSVMEATDTAEIVPDEASWAELHKFSSPSQSPVSDEESYSSHVPPLSWNNKLHNNIYNESSTDLISSTQDKTQEHPMSDGMAYTLSFLVLAFMVYMSMLRMPPPREHQYGAVVARQYQMQLQREREEAQYKEETPEQRQARIQSSLMVQKIISVDEQGNLTLSNATGVTGPASNNDNNDDDDDTDENTPVVGGDDDLSTSTGIAAIASVSERTLNPMSDSLDITENGAGVAAAATTTEYTTGMMDEVEDGCSTCVICLDVFQVGDVVAWSRQNFARTNSLSHTSVDAGGGGVGDGDGDCMHVFHYDCLMEWLQHPLHNDCPACRSIIVASPSKSDPSIVGSSDDNGTTSAAVGEGLRADTTERTEDYTNTAFVIMHGLVSRVRRTSYSLIGQHIQVVHEGGGGSGGTNNKKADGELDGSEGWFVGGRATAASNDCNDRKDEEYGMTDDSSGTTHLGTIHSPGGRRKSIASLFPGRTRYMALRRSSSLTDTEMTVLSSEGESSQETEAADKSDNVTTTTDVKARQSRPSMRRRSFTKQRKQQQQSSSAWMEPTPWNHGRSKSVGSSMGASASHASSDLVVSPPVPPRIKLSPLVLRRVVSAGPNHSSANAHSGRRKSSTSASRPYGVGSDFPPLPLSSRSVPLRPTSMARAAALVAAADDDDSQDDMEKDKSGSLLSDDGRTPNGHIEGGILRSTGSIKKTISSSTTSPTVAFADMPPLPPISGTKRPASSKQLLSGAPVQRSSRDVFLPPLPMRRALSASASLKGGTECKSRTSINNNKKTMTISQPHAKNAGNEDVNEGTGEVEDQALVQNGTIV